MSATINKHSLPGSKFSVLWTTFCRIVPADFFIMGKHNKKKENEKPPTQTALHFIETRQFFASIS